MTIPRIAIVGRPNVGKSSLLNRLARKRVSIVAPVPGVTRDRVTTMIELDAPEDAEHATPPRLVEVTDTGGFGAYTADGAQFDDVGADLASLAPEIEVQIDFAIDGSDLILLAVDAQAGLTALDQAIAGRLRTRGAAPRVICVANKADSEHWDAEAGEASRLGFAEPMCVSATNGRGVDALLDAIARRLPPPGDPADEAPGEMKLAIVGRRNAGKSTLINALAGEPRVIVSEIAGTTRDAVDVRMQIKGRTLIAIDTAGVRKKKSFADEVESYAYQRMLAAVARADVVVFLVDATTDVSQVDKKLSAELQRLSKPTVIAVNKWDLVGTKLAPADYIDYLTRQLRGLDFAPIVCLSAHKGQGIEDVIAMAFNLFEQASHWEPTAQLNRLIESILQRRGPTSRLGTQAKVYYVAQIDIRPPTFALVVNKPELFEGAYERYLHNRLHEELACSEVPIRLVFRARRRVELERK